MLPTTSAYQPAVKVCFLDIQDTPASRQLPCAILARVRAAAERSEMHRMQRRGKCAHASCDSLSCQSGPFCLPPYRRCRVGPHRRASCQPRTSAHSSEGRRPVPSLNTGVSVWPGLVLRGRSVTGHCSWKVFPGLGRTHTYETFRLFATAAAIAAVSVTPVAAQGKSGAAPKGGKQTTTSAAPTNHGQSHKVSGNTSSSTTTSPGSNGAARSAAAKTSNPGAGKKPVTTTAGAGTTTTSGGKHDLRQHDGHDNDRDHDDGSPPARRRPRRRRRTRCR